MVWYYDIISNRRESWSAGEKVPNDKTLKIMKEIEEGKNLKSFDSLEELYKDLHPDGEKKR